LRTLFNPNPLRGLKRTTRALMALLLCLVQPAFAELPNQRAVATKDAAGFTILQHWSNSRPSSQNMVRRSVPDLPEFNGAASWVSHIVGDDPAKVSLSAFAEAGMTNVRIVAHAPGNKPAMQVLDNHPDSAVHSVMVTGRINGRPAKGIALILFGGKEEQPRKSGVHGFSAPSDVFEALGGFAVPAVQHVMGQTAATEDMSLDGRLAPDAQVTKLNQFFASWVSSYVIPMTIQNLQIQSQTNRNMQSWNNAIGVCAGDPSCTVAPMNDGSGNWQPSTN